MINTLRDVDDAATVTHEYQPFLLDGIGSHSSDSEGKSVKILIDTGSVQSLIRKELLPSLSNYACVDVLIRGIGIQCLSLPLHDLYLRSDLVNGPVRLGVCSHLPVEGVDVILGNDLTGDVFPRPVEISEPNASDCSRLVPCFAAVFSACTVTYAQTRKFRDVVDLSETVLDKFCCLCAACKLPGNPNQKLPVVPLLPTPVIREPFERLLIDHVGPLPKSKKKKTL